MKTCTVEDCANAHNAKGLCNKHYHRMKRNGTLERHRPSQAGSRNPNWRGDGAAYTTVHSRLQLNPASEHTCVECGEQAKDWAYTYGCPNERQSEFGPYTSDLNRYQPMCRPCHKVFDYNAGQVPA